MRTQPLPLNTSCQLILIFALCTWIAVISVLQALT